MSATASAGRSGPESAVSDVRARPTPVAEPTSAGRGTQRPLSQTERDRILQSPFVRQVMDVFNARVIDIRPDRALGPPGAGVPGVPGAPGADVEPETTQENEES